MRVDLNSDLGEGFGPWKMGDDLALLDIVTTVNLACGFHAGDPNIMRSTAEAAMARGVSVGAHPGFQDLIGFGRRRLPGLSIRELENLIAYQVGACQATCALAGYHMSHVKTHGALGNMCAENDELAMAVARAIKAVDPDLAFMVMPGVATERAAMKHGIRPIMEVYADRTYDDDFNLTNRSLPGAVIHDSEVAVARALKMISRGQIESVSGKTLDARIDSICVHGDNPAAIALGRNLREGLESSGVAVLPATRATDEMNAT